MALEWPQFGEEAREKDSVDDVAFGMTSCCHSFSHIPGADQDRVLVEWAIADSMRCQWGSRDCVRTRKSSRHPPTLCRSLSTAPHGDCRGCGERRRRQTPD